MSPAERHLIIGGDGGVGRALAEHLRQAGHEALTTSRRASGSPSLRLDLGDVDQVERFVIPSGTSRVYLLAAVTSLKACRQDEPATRRINVDAVARLARRAADARAVPVLVSTNLVFDGSRPFRTTIEPPHPTTAYGRQKANAEAAVLSAGGAVIRPGKIIPPSPGPALLSQWVQALKNNQPVSAFHDLRIAPVSLGSLLDALTSASPGIAHLSAARDVSYEEIAAHVAERLGVDPALVNGASAADTGIPPEERPRHTTLACALPTDPWQVLDNALGLDDLDRRA